MTFEEVVAEEYEKIVQYNPHVHLNDHYIKILTRIIERMWNKLEENEK